jgi:hypothetical protein
MLQIPLHCMSSVVFYAPANNRMIKIECSNSEVVSQTTSTQWFMLVQAPQR